jgi:hypothetical protein
MSINGGTVEQQPQDVQKLTRASKAAFNALFLITQACHGILNTVFTAPTPKPTWFDELQSKLDTAKVHARDWVDNIAPGITAGAPVAVINYGTTYAALTSGIQPIVAAHPDAQGADNQYVIQVHELVAVLEQQVQSILGNNDVARLKNWTELLQASYDTLIKFRNDDAGAKAAAAAAITALDSALQAAADACKTLSELNPAWTSLQSALQGVVAELDAGNVPLGAVVGDAFTPAVAAAWADAVASVESLPRGNLQTLG